MHFLLVEDHPLMRSGLAQLLVRQFSGATVSEVESAAAAIQSLSNSPADLIILDIDLPDRSGLDILADLKALAPQTPVLMLTAQEETEFGRRALHAGASGFVHKSSPPGEIIGAVERLLQGKKYVSQDLATSLIDHPAQSSLTLHQALSTREFEVLRLLGKGSSVTDISQRLGLSVKTVSTYRTRILQKLHLQTTGEIVRYAVEHHLV